MLITSSRKPSGKTKILCKTLALFFDCTYMTRGKMSLSEVLEEGRENIVLIVGEFHGNPGSLSFYDTAGTLYLSLHISETHPSEIRPEHIRKGLIGLVSDGAAVDGASGGGAAVGGVSGGGAAVGGVSGGEPSRASVLFGLFSETVFEGLVPKAEDCGRILSISDDCLSFSVKGQTFMKLYVKGMKTY